MSSVEANRFQNADVDIVDATCIHINLVGVRAWNIKRVHAACPTKMVFRDAGVELVGRKRRVAGQECEMILRNDQM